MREVHTCCGTGKGKGREGGRGMQPYRVPVPLSDEIEMLEMRWDA
jgi:hypothetical protein